MSPLCGVAGLFGIAGTIGILGAAICGRYADRREPPRVIAFGAALALASWMPLAFGSRSQASWWA